VLLVNKQLEIQYLSPTHVGKVHDKRVVDGSPYPLPQGSVLLQDLGFLGFTLEGVEIEMPTKKPKGRELTAEQKAINFPAPRSGVLAALRLARFAAHLRFTVPFEHCSFRTPQAAGNWTRRD
jgi:hypothetical protein